MERIEMIEQLKNKAMVTYEEAKEALEKCNWDLLNAIIYLERKGKVNNSGSTDLVKLSKESDSKDENKEESKKEKSSGFGALLGRFFKFIEKAIKKGNKNYFEIKKDNEEPIRVSLTISTILLLIAFWPVAILLLVGLFLGYKYSLSGPDIKSDTVNNVFEKASTSAKDIKKDFQQGYKNI